MPNKKLADHVQSCFSAALLASKTFLDAPKSKRIAMSAVASSKTSGVFVTIIFFFLAAWMSIFPKPTAKFAIIFTEGDNLLIKFSSNLSVIAERIPSQSFESSKIFSEEYSSSF